MEILPSAVGKPVRPLPRNQLTLDDPRPHHVLVQLVATGVGHADVLARFRPLDAINWANTNSSSDATVEPNIPVSCP